MKLIASIFGIGYIKGGGTLAAIVAALVWYCIHPLFGMQLLLIALITFVGIYSGNKVEKDWGKDSSRVVIDEVAGMLLSLLLIPIHWSTVLAALLLFRFFDIVKPLGVRRMEVFRGGWGVMADDLLAGVYANIVLQVLLQLQLFPEII